MFEKPLPIVVIGGGFSGTLTAIRLSRRLPETPVILLEETAEAGPGLAYRDSDASAWLNVPAGKMSAFNEKPDDFLDYARTILGEGVQEEDFLPRRIYGNYIKSLLCQAVAENPLLKIDSRKAVDLTSGNGRENARVILKDQTFIEASHVVLATGNQGSAFASSLWAQHTKPARDPGSLDQIKDGDSVLIVGSGLTMIDTVLDLDRRGNAATIHIISRNGLLPKEYAPASPLELPDLDHLPDSNLRKAVRLFRNAIRDHEAKGGDWRDIFHAIRSSTPSLWQELSDRDKTKFLRLVSPFWEVHRHQCPPETLHRIHALIASGKLVQHRGTIVTVEKTTGRFRMGLAARNRNAATRSIEADHLLDATGPARDIQTVRHPLIQNLLRRGFIKPDAHRLGAETSADYRAVGRDNKPSPWLHIVGPMLRARYYEATAVSELRLHAASLASRIEKELKSREADKLGV
ncbi:MAG TPA: FAD/NAD(P)-binding protein [Luteolibacter sp.]|nr:FAD/NAD(P)-binding protein [Luteolibacter sp.]